MTVHRSEGSCTRWTIVRGEGGAVGWLDLEMFPHSHMLWPGPLRVAPPEPSRMILFTVASSSEDACGPAEHLVVPSSTSALRRKAYGMNTPYACHMPA